MNAVILGCSSMAKAIDAAQKKTGTDHPVYLISRKYHSSPGQMLSLIHIFFSLM